MSPEESYDLLARLHVGRLAFSWKDRVGILPLHYVYEYGWIYGRTSGGEKTRLVQHNPWVAFEVDEIRGLFDWRSVVAAGRLTILDPALSPGEQERYDRARAALAGLLTREGYRDDPTPERSLFFSIAVSEVTGRRASAAGA